MSASGSTRVGLRVTATALAAPEVGAPRLPRAARRGEAEREPAAVLGEPDRVDDALVGQLEPPDERQRLRVVEVEARVAVDVRVHDERPSLRVGDAVEVPVVLAARTPSVPLAMS